MLKADLLEGFRKRGSAVRQMFFRQKRPPGGTFFASKNGEKRKKFGEYDTQGSRVITNLSTN